MKTEVKIKLTGDQVRSLSKLTLSHKDIAYYSKNEKGEFIEINSIAASRVKFIKL